MIYKNFFKKLSSCGFKENRASSSSSKSYKVWSFYFLKLLYKSLSSSCSNSVSSIFKELLISISFTIFATLLNVAL